ncbi:conditioned medium-induced protein 4 [Haloarcula montana]|uniref:conditioned medium-induced protein 4 n=1 Tax=Haloarcula montana TaxID=3111776 RepID=UPI002D787CAF|nr:conditioned medium-induced protein 4 [Haloarcula sp. GH36]
MDEKTEDLRELFIDVSGEERVTESQEDTRGSLADADGTSVSERLSAVVSRMRERYEFRTDLDDEQLVAVVRGFYEGESDAALADRLDADEDTVVRARLDLHLLREADDDVPFDVSAFRKRVVNDDATDADLAAEFGVEESAATHYRTVVEAQAAARRVSHRFQSEFEDVLTEAGLSTQHTAAIRESGLEEATEDIDSLDSDADVSM